LNSCWHSGAELVLMELPLAPINLTLVELEIPL
jgi:hypothetical protein